MVTPKHFCPWGIKAHDLLKRHGFVVEDHHLESMDANEAYKRENGVDETPQIKMNGQNIGGYDQLREHLGLGPDPKEGKSYQPIAAVLAVTLLMAFVSCWAMLGKPEIIRSLELFIAFSMCVLGILKLQNLQSFANGFIQYDLIARRYVPYSAIYAFVETGAGILMIGSVLTWLAAPAALFISMIGAISVIKAVYMEKRDLNCACVGGGSKVPLGLVSLIENLMMIAMSLWMLQKAI